MTEPLPSRSAMHRDNPKGSRLVLSDLVAEAALLDVSGDSETPPDSSVDIQNENSALRELQLRSIAQQDREETKKEKGMNLRKDEK